MPQSKRAVKSVKERLERLKTKNSPYSLAQELDTIAQRCASLPVLDSRSPEELIGYVDTPPAEARGILGSAIELT